jgi:hypothetical protein
VAAERYATANYGKQSRSVASGLSSSTSDEEWHSALRNRQKRLAATIAKSFPEIEERLEASAEDRVGLGGTRKRFAEARTELQPVVRA